MAEIKSEIKESMQVVKDAYPLMSEREKGEFFGFCKALISLKRRESNGRDKNICN